jgi:hypothetical protein
MNISSNFLEVSNIEAFIQIYNLYLKNNQKIQIFLLNKKMFEIKTKNFILSNVEFFN